MINSRYATSLTRTGTNEGRGYPIHSMRTGSSFDFKTGLRMGRTMHVKKDTSAPPIRIDGRVRGKLLKAQTKLEKRRQDYAMTIARLPSAMNPECYTRPGSMTK